MPPSPRLSPHRGERNEGEGGLPVVAAGLVPAGRFPNPEGRRTQGPTLRNRYPLTLPSPPVLFPPPLREGRGRVSPSAPLTSPLPQRGRGIGRPPHPALSPRGGEGLRGPLTLPSPPTGGRGIKGEGGEGCGVGKGWRGSRTNVRPDPDGAASAGGRRGGTVAPAVAVGLVPAGSEEDEGRRTQGPTLRKPTAVADELRRDGTPRYGVGRRGLPRRKARRPRFDRGEKEG